MSYGDSRIWNVPWRRVQGFPANEIGDTTAGATANVQTFLDARRNYKGKVADLTARNALSGLSDGDWVLVLDSDGDDNPAAYVWRGAPITAWKDLTTSGGGGGSMSTPQLLGVGNASNNTFALPVGAGTQEMIWKGGAIQLGGGVDYTRTGQNIVFVAGNIPAVGESVVAAYEVSVLAGTDAQTLQGVAASAFQRKGVPFSDLRAVGLLEGMVGFPIGDHDVVETAKTIRKIVIEVPSLPAAGVDVIVDILKRDAPGGALTSLYAAAPANRPKVTCNGGMNWAVATLPGTTALPDNCALIMQIVQAPAGAEDVRVKLFD